MANMPLHLRLQFDTDHGQVLDQTRRYVLMRADVLMGLFNQLEPVARSSALHALGNSVTLHGADSVRAYAAQTGVTPSIFLDTIVSSAASLGWGCWRFEAVSGGLRLSVVNSPFASAALFDDTSACHAISGMLEAVGMALWDIPCRAQELHCNALHPSSRGAACIFELSPMDPAICPAVEFHSIFSTNQREEFS